MTEEINLLQGELEAATAQLRELTTDRDNTWETYQLLLSRQIEEQVANQTVSSEVRIGDRAFVPIEPLPRGLLRNTILAFVVGWVFASSVLLLLAWWHQDKIQDETMTLPFGSGNVGSSPEQPSPSGLPESLSS